MGFKLSNPVKSISNAVTGIIKKPTSLNSWTNAALTTGSGGWLESDAADKAAQAEKEAAAKRASKNAITAGKQEGYDEAKSWYGVGQKEIAPQVKAVGEQLKGMSEGAASNPVIAAMYGQAASSRANAARNAAAQGLKGGAAIGAIDAVGRAADQQAATNIYNTQMNATNAYRDYLSNVIGGSRKLAYDTAALRNPAPSVPEQKSWVDDLFGGIV